MKISQKISLCFLTLFFTSNHAKNYNFEHFSSTATININGQEFCSIKKSDNGTLSEQFLINQVPVEKDQYIQELNAAKLTDMNEQEKESQRKIDEQQALHHTLKKALLEKLIKELIMRLQADMTILEEPLLQQYLTFHQQGITSQADLEQLKHWHSNIQKNLKTTFSEHNVSMLQKLAHDIETKAEQIAHCLKQSVQKATSECDDTATLKRLLALIEM